LRTMPKQIAVCGQLDHVDNLERGVLAKSIESPTNFDSNC
jgi:hypothetical protein